MSTIRVRFLEAIEGRAAGNEEELPYGVAAAYVRAGHVQVLPPGPEPPSIAEVLRAGYTQEAAERIVAREKKKQQAGHPPYGDNLAPEKQFSISGLVTSRDPYRDEGEAGETVPLAGEGDPADPDFDVHVQPGETHMLAGPPETTARRRTRRR